MWQSLHITISRNHEIGLYHALHYDLNNRDSNRLCRMA